MSTATLLKPEKTTIKQQVTVTPPITSNPKRMGGDPVIGTERMPVTTLLDFLIGGESISAFSEVYGTSEENCKAALQVLRDAIDQGKLTDLIAERVDY
ncbi:MAG: DUF433 domain-containing protein [Acidobacteriota bacterium]|nr:DUF433 domain-containing protein [Acidobacteriota bacterium]